jgi:hypothetical protein
MEPAEERSDEGQPASPTDESVASAPDAAPNETTPSPAPWSLDHFSVEAQKMLATATEHARRLGHAEIRPDHLLLAFLFDPGATTIRSLFQSAGVDAPERVRLREALIERLRRAEVATNDMLRLSDGCKRVLQTALVEAAHRSRPVAPAQNRVEPSHLMIGLISEGSAFLGSQITANLAIRGMRVAFGAGAWRPGRPRPEPTRPPLPLVQRGIEVATDEPPAGTNITRANVVTFRVTDAELAAVDALVESGAMRSRSEASGWLLHAGIDAKREFFDQIRTLGDEIARLRQEVQRLADEHIGRQTTVEHAPPGAASTGPAASPEPAPPTAQTS